MKLILDTETISLEKPFVYDLGYTIADADGNIIPGWDNFQARCWQHYEE